MTNSPPSGAVEIRAVAETGSTNEDMKLLARDGAPEGIWLRALRQTSGRGRMGRTWENGEGNLLASTLVRLVSGDPPAPTLALVCAVAVYEALAGFAGRDAITIKWPNDIIARTLSAKAGTGSASGSPPGDIYAKLCGMLLERAGDAVIVGVGVNIAKAPDISGRITCCLDGLAGRTCAVETVLDAIARHFALALDRWRTYGVEPVVRAWLERAHPSGTPLAVQLPDGSRMEGHFETLDPGGALILRLADGGCHAIHAGDVFLL